MVLLQCISISYNTEQCSSARGCARHWCGGTRRCRGKHKMGSSCSYAHVGASSEGWGGPTWWRDEVQRWRSYGFNALCNLVMFSTNKCMHEPLRGTKSIPEVKTWLGEAWRWPVTVNRGNAMVLHVKEEFGQGRALSDGQGRMGEAQ